MIGMLIRENNMYFIHRIINNKLLKKGGEKRDLKRFI